MIYEVSNFVKISNDFIEMLHHGNPECAVSQSQTCNGAKCNKGKLTAYTIQIVQCSNPLKHGSIKHNQSSQRLFSDTELFP